MSRDIQGQLNIFDFIENPEDHSTSGKPDYKGATDEITRYSIELAHDLVRDLETLENIQYSQRAQHWVGFITADLAGMDPLAMYSTEFIDDFKEWVEAEIKKLEDKLSKL